MVVVMVVVGMLGGGVVKRPVCGTAPPISTATSRYCAPKNPSLQEHVPIDTGHGCLLGTCEAQSDAISRPPSASRSDLCIYHLSTNSGNVCVRVCGAPASTHFGKEQRRWAVADGTVPSLQPKSEAPVPARLPTSVRAGRSQCNGLHHLTRLGKRKLTIPSSLIPVLPTPYPYPTHTLTTP
jgi:hypothetical protein